MVDLTNKNEHIFLDYDSLGKKKALEFKKKNEFTVLPLLRNS